MSKHRKSWSQQEKLAIIKYSDEHGVGKASVEYEVASSMIYRWKSDLEDGSKDSGISHYKQKNKALEREIASLKEIVADQALALKIKEEILKKKMLKDQF